MGKTHDKGLALAVLGYTHVAIWRGLRLVSSTVLLDMM